MLVGKDIKPLTVVKGILRLRVGFYAGPDALAVGRLPRGYVAQTTLCVRNDSCEHLHLWTGGGDQEARQGRRTFVHQRGEGNREAKERGHHEPRRPEPAAI